MIYDVIIIKLVLYIAYVTRVYSSIETYLIFFLIQFFYQDFFLLIDQSNAFIKVYSPFGNVAFLTLYHVTCVM